MWVITQSNWWDLSWFVGTSGDNPFLNKWNPLNSPCFVFINMKRFMYFNQDVQDFGLIFTRHFKRHKIKHFLNYLEINKTKNTSGLFNLKQYNQLGVCQCQVASQCAKIASHSVCLPVPFLFLFSLFFSLSLSLAHPLSPIHSHTLNITGMNNWN